MNKTSSNTASANNNASKAPPSILTGTVANVRMTNLGSKGVVYNFSLYLKGDGRDGEIVNASAFNPKKTPTQGALARVVGTETEEKWEKEGVPQTGKKIVTNGRGYVELCGKGIGKKAA